MIFETSIKTISKFVAIFIMIILLGGIYLSLKGYDINTGTAKAQELTSNNIDSSSVILSSSSEPKIIGDVNAPITMYEFSSFTCGHCATFHTRTLPMIKSKYIDDGKVKLVFADFPLGDLAAKASMLTRCIDDSKYEAFVNNLFENQSQWGRVRGTQKLKEYALANGMTSEEITSCLENHKLYYAIMDYREQVSSKYKIGGTPSFVIDDGKTQEVIRGAVSYDVFVATIDKKLKELN